MIARRPFRLLPGMTLAAVFCLANPAYALITGGEGNTPLENRPQWPVGAVDVANMPSRIAWWEGPPFGGGEWHFEYRGDAAALNEALKRLAAIQGQKPRLVIHDGRAESFWLNPNRDPMKKQPMDWTFTVWEAANYERLFGSSASRFMSRSPQFGKPLPPAELTVYTGNGLDWSKVKVPDGVEVLDQRLTAHGYEPNDGAVIELSVHDLQTGAPLSGAELVIERRPAQKPNEPSEVEVTRAESNAEGLILLKSLPREALTLSIRKPGFVSRTIDYLDTEAILWKRYDATLAKGHRVTGSVVDETGNPVPKASVRLQEFLDPDGRPYGGLEALSARTDDQGQFTLENVPAGTARYTASAVDYITVGLGEVLVLSEKPVMLKVTASGKMKVTVKGAKGPFVVNVAPEGGEKVGSWGGSSQLGPDGTCVFTDIPPGRYTVHSRPNPGGEADRTPDVTVAVKPRETAEVLLKAK